jgi:hypothetical protein
MGMMVDAMMMMPVMVMMDDDLRLGGCDGGEGQ